jgi:hypothetical protein
MIVDGVFDRGSYPIRDLSLAGSRIEVQHVNGIMLVDQMDHHINRYRLLRKRWTLSCSVAILALAFGRETLAGESESRTYGDPAVRTALDAQAKRIYELATGPGLQVELITRDNPLQLEGAFGTEATASIIGGSEARILATVWTRQGKYSIEFYREGDKLLMVYETFSFFVESAPPDAWHNFMGLAAWESHIYFDADGKVSFAETSGRQAPPPEIIGKQLLQQSQSLAKLLSRSPARWERR